ncbi:MAG: hypothetical protein ACM31C_15875 [Acidobacteriota bacterium]
MNCSLAFVVLAIATGVAQAQPPKKPSAVPAPVEVMAPADVTRWLAFFDKLVQAVEVNARSCEKMAADVRTVIDTNRPSIALARDARKHGKKLPRAAQQRMLDGVRRMGPGIENCSNNEKVKAAFAKLETE